MKIFINTSNWAILKVENEVPVVSGDNYVDTIKVYYNNDPDSLKFYPTLNLLKPNDRKVGLIQFDIGSNDDTFPKQYTDDDSNTWWYFEFTLSNNDGHIDVSGKYQVTIVTNYYDSTTNTVIKQRNTNVQLNVLHAVTNDDNDILLLGDDPSEIVASLYQISQTINSNISIIMNRISGLSNGKVDKSVTDNSTTSIIFNTGDAVGRTLNATGLTISDELTDDGYVVEATDGSTTSKIQVKEGQTVSNVTDGTNTVTTKATKNYFRVIATNGNTTKTFDIAPQSININGKDVVVEDDLTAEATARQNADTTLQTNIDNEALARGNADTSLQTQIDAINAAQNLADIVADLTALNNYDTSVLEANDKVEVLSDSDHDYSATVYNWTGSAWQYIGKYGDSYSKAESDAKYVSLAGTQTISGAKTFTNNTFWAIEDSSNRKAQINAYADYLYITYFKDSSLDNYVQKTINATNLYVRTEISNNGKTSQDYMSNTQREIYIVNNNGNNSMRIGNSYAYLDDHYENDNYSSLGQVGISNNKPYINWELTSKNNNSTSWQTMINFLYRGLDLYTANKNTYDYSEIELGDESIKLSVSNEDNSDNDKTLELSMSNGLTLNGNKIIDTANASTELFMTDAEMDTLIGEVFN